MTAADVLNGPFAVEWTMPPTGSTAADLAPTLARHDTGALGRWHEQLATAVNELHGDRIGAGSDPKGDGLHGAWGVGDPIVALVRAVASLARRRPTARSTTAQRLIDQLRSDSRDQSASAS